MKTSVCLIVLFLTLPAYSQNAFADGIQQSDVVEFKDGDLRFNGSGFKLVTTGNCGVLYEVNEIWNDKNKLTNYVTKTRWSWQDIATIEIDTVKNILRLNGREPMPKIQKNIDSGEVVDDPANNTVNIYFKNKDLVLNAGKWALEQTKTCGGKVLMIN